MTSESKGRLLLTALLLTLTACVTPVPRSAAETHADEVTAQRIYTALNADPTYYFRHVDVSVEDGVARLGGYIWSPEALYRAEQLAGHVPGVKRVVNQMELEREGDRGGGHSGTG